jgi:hypothetical protein
LALCQRSRRASEAGRFGRDFLAGAARVGLAYYAQWKLTDDSLTGLPALIVHGNNRVAALEPEVSIPIATKETVCGFLTARYQWEIGARTTTQGDPSTSSWSCP